MFSNKHASTENVFIYDQNQNHTHIFLEELIQILFCRHQIIRLQIHPMLEISLKDQTAAEQYTVKRTIRQLVIFLIHLHQLQHQALTVFCLVNLCLSHQFHSHLCGWSVLLSGYCHRHHHKYLHIIHRVCKQFKAVTILCLLHLV